MQNARHVVVVMNGTARWAVEQQRPLAEAQRESLAVARNIARAAASAHVRYLTFCGEHAELPTYPMIPVRPLGLNPEVPLHPSATVNQDRQAWTARDLWSGGDELVVTLRLGQSGRRDIVTAIAKLAKAVQAGLMDPDRLDESLLRSSLPTVDLPDPDLILYTGCRAGEHRLGDDLIFESAYAEFFFSDRLWPAFSANDFAHSLGDFASRQRRYGKTAEQITSGDSNAARYLVASSSIGS